MYNKQLDAFVCSAELGSFSKAANKLFITPTSLIQQINLLEKHLNIQLFHRSSRGVTLTNAGISLFEDAKNIIHLSEIAIERAQSINNQRGNVIRVGTSLFTKCKYLTDIWSRTLATYPDIRIELVSQKSISSMTKHPLADLGIEYDLQEGIYIDGLYKDKCNFLNLFPAKLSICVPKGHRLVKKEKISFNDLNGETIMIPSTGHTPAFDIVRHTLQTTISNLTLIDNNFYDINIFATCELNNYLLLSLDVWSDIYPSLNTIPFDFDVTVPYGLIYTLKPTTTIQKLITTANNLVENDFFN